MLTIFEIKIGVFLTFYVLSNLPWDVHVKIYYLWTITTFAKTNVTKRIELFCKSALIERAASSHLFLDSLLSIVLVEVYEGNLAVHS